MTNPDSAIGTNAAYSGRTSVNAFNDGLAAYSRGILSGWNCQVSTGLTVILGGSAYTRDVAIAQDNAGNKTTINNISGDEVPVTLGAAPGANSRIDAIVAYVDNPPQGDSTEADNPGACGIIAVTGTPAVAPVEPNESAIRSAITADGASGATAYYVVLAKVTVPTGTTDLIAGYIEQGAPAKISSNNTDYSVLPTILSGTTDTKSCGAGGSTDFDVNLPTTLADNSYTVVATLRGGGAYWGDGLMWKILSKSTSSFAIQVWNANANAVSGVNFDWVLVKQPS